LQKQLDLDVNDFRASSGFPADPDFRVLGLW
jgi:hypothetical protein